jgi:nucleoside-diphosphate-sugar epimerase
LADSSHIIDPNCWILVTGSTGFIGSRVVSALLELGYRNIRCLVRPSSDPARLQKIGKKYDCELNLVGGNLLSPKDCELATDGISVIYHLAAGTGTKSFADAFVNSVITTRNLLDGAVTHGCLRRFVNVSSFAVYNAGESNAPGVLDENCPTQTRFELSADAYAFAKAKQDELVADYGRKHNIPYVFVRPGVVYGPGKNRIHGRVGLDTFGIFLHLGGSNPIPFSFVDNCADAIALAGLKPGVDGQVFNLVDDDLPSSREFLTMYKQEVGHFWSLNVPHSISYLLCYGWEKYSAWSKGQLPPVYNRRVWANSWKRTTYPNTKLKEALGWRQKVPTAEGLKQFFVSCREKPVHA